jgi:hypothetical protein
MKVIITGSTKNETLAANLKAGAIPGRIECEIENRIVHDLDEVTCVYRTWEIDGNKLAFVWRALDDAGYVDSGRGGEESKDTFAVIYAKNKLPDG